MLYLKLCKPMILDVQIPEIMEKYKIDPSMTDDFYSVLNCSKYFVQSEDGPGFFETHAMDINDIKSCGFEDRNILTGVDAIVGYCTQDGGSFDDYIKEINVPVEFYYESCSIVWDNVCYLFARVERQNSKLRTVLKINAPSIIQRNEERMLRKYLEELEHNHCHEKDRRDVCLKDDNGMIFRSLNDGGFSMIHGWDKEILEERERDFQEFLKEENMTESEAEKYKPIFMDDGCTKDGE